MLEALTTAGVGYIIGLISGAWFERKWWIRNLRKHNVPGRWVQIILKDEEEW